jgi:hypothetical protein
MVRDLPGSARYSDAEGRAGLALLGHVAEHPVAQGSIRVGIVSVAVRPCAHSTSPPALLWRARARGARHARAPPRLSDPRLLLLSHHPSPLVVLYLVLASLEAFEMLQMHLDLRVR